MSYICLFLQIYSSLKERMALKWPSVCWCAVKKLLTHSLKERVHGLRLRQRHTQTTVFNHSTNKQTTTDTFQSQYIDNKQRGHRQQNYAPPKRRHDVQKSAPKLDRKIRRRRKRATNSPKQISQHAYGYPPHRTETATWKLGSASPPGRPSLTCHNFFPTF